MQVQLADEYEGVPEAMPVKEIKVVELDNPEYLARNRDLHALIGEFVAHYCGPSVSFESVLNFMSTLVYSVYAQKQAGVYGESITVKYWLGFVDNVLDGFFVYFMAADRMPHIQSIDVPYIYSRDIEVTLLFLGKLEASRKRWGIRHILMNLANERLRENAERLFVKPRKISEHYVVEGIRFGLTTEGD
jgi:hypothetical protein